MLISVKTLRNHAVFPLISEIQKSIASTSEVKEWRRMFRDGYKFYDFIRYTCTLFLYYCIVQTQWTWL